MNGSLLGANRSPNRMFDYVHYTFFRPKRGGVCLAGGARPGSAGPAVRTGWGFSTLASNSDRNAGRTFPALDLQSKNTAP
jgi:hypothetical protein